MTGQSTEHGPTDVVAHCVNHRRRLRTAACGTCGHALCTACVVHTSVGIKCESCTGVRGAGAHGSSSPVEPARADGARRRSRALALVAGAVVVLVAAGYGLASKGSSPSTTADLGGSPVAVERSAEFVGAAGTRIGGTLTLPDGAAVGQVPAVLIVPGFGALNRNAVAAAGTPDGLNDALSSSMNPSSPGRADNLFQDVSKALAQAGIASLRYDKRGTVNTPLRPDQKLSFDDEVADARAALQFLAERREIGGAAPLAVVGHDEGGLVALRAAAGMPQVKAAVLLATPGRPLVDVLAGDLTRSRGPALAEQLRAAVATLRSAGTVPAASSLSPLLRPLFPAGADGYVATLFSLDPALELRVAPPSVLVVRAEGDQTVSAVDVDRLSAARPGTETLLGSADANHNLTLAGTDHEHGSEGTPALQRDAEVLGKLAGWVKIHLAP